MLIIFKLIEISFNFIFYQIKIQRMPPCSDAYRNKNYSIVKNINLNFFIFIFQYYLLNLKFLILYNLFFSFYNDHSYFLWNYSLNFFKAYNLWWSFSSGRIRVVILKWWVPGLCLNPLPGTNAIPVFLRTYRQ